MFECGLSDQSLLVQFESISDEQEVGRISGRWCMAFALQLAFVDAITNTAY